MSSTPAAAAAASSGGSERGGGGSGGRGNSRRRPRGGRGGGGGTGASGGNSSNNDKNSKINTGKKKQLDDNISSGGDSKKSSGKKPAADKNVEKKKRRPPRRKKSDKDKNNDKTGTGSQPGQQSQKQPPQPKKKNSKQKSKKKEPSEEELRILAEKKAQQEKEAELQRQRDLEEKQKAAKLLKKQQLEQSIQDKIDRLSSFVSKTERHCEVRDELTSEHLLESRKAFQESKKTLKSDLKKCTAFCKKIKSAPSFDENTLKTLLKDINTLNLTRYLEEISNAFLESKLKVVDVGGVVQVCTALHQRYSEFMDGLLPTILKVFRTSSNNSSADDAKQKRIYLRVLTEMLNFGVLPETKPVMKIVADAAGVSGSSGGEKYAVTDPHMLVSFAKAAGHELLGVIPKSILMDVEFLQEQIMKMTKNEDTMNSSSTDYDNNDNEDDGNSDEVDKKVPSVDDEANTSPTNEAKIDEIIEISPALIEKAKEVIQTLEGVKDVRSVTSDVSDRFRKHLVGALQYLSESYIATHKKLSKMEKRCEQDRLLAGSLTEQREKTLEDARNLLESLRKSVEALAEILNESVPELFEEEDEAKNEGTGLEVYKGEDGQDTNLGPFDDEETRSFYCDIPDLLTTIPPALLGYTLEDVERMQETNTKKYGSGLPDEEGSDELGETVEEGDGNEKEYLELDSNTEGMSAGVNTEEYDSENKDTPHYKLMLLIEEELPECNRRDSIDEVAEKFCTNHGATKNARKRLEKALFLVPRSRLDLIPYYSRLAAILDRVFPDITLPLVTELEKQFHGLERWKKQQSIENRIRNARFIGELTKFGAAPPIVSLRCLKRCVQDFSGLNVDIACCLLESCGRFLHQTKLTTLKLAQIMETMVRIRKAKHFDERTIELMNSAFYAVQPPQRKTRERVKVLSPIEAYLKDLLLVRLDKSNISYMSKQILRLPWSDPVVDYGALTVKYMLKACRKGRYKSISAIASLVSHMKKPKPEILARIIDGVLEELQIIMENPNIRDQQRAVVYTKLLGELHSLSLVSSQAIFDQLYNFVNFDHDIPPSLHEACLSQTKDDPTTSLACSLKTSLGITKAINEDEEMEADEVEEENDNQEEVDESPVAVAVSIHSKYDPRVPSPLDPPSAVFRIKLICTLLDSCVSSLVTSSNFSKLEKFLVAFQRYLFIKHTLPTDIEFSLLDTFDLIESSLKDVKKDSKRSASVVRHKTWLEAHNAVIATEESEAITKQKARNRLLAQAGIVNASPDDDDDGDEILEDDQISLGSADDMSVNSLDDDQSVDQSDGAISDDDMSEEEESDDDTDDDDDELYNEDEEINQAAAHQANMQKLEDEAFDRELRKLTMEALEKGKSTARTMASAKVSSTMPSADQIIRKKTSESGVGNETNDNVIPALSGASGMNFQLIKRGHKGRVETRSLVVPSDTNLARVATKQDNEVARERDMLKARVLRYVAESAEQPYSGDVYMNPTKLVEVHNRTLHSEEIDRQFRGPRTSYGGRGLKRV